MKLLDNVRARCISAQTLLFCGFYVVDQLFYVHPFVCGGSVLVFILVCISLCPFWFQLDEEERAGC